MTAFIGRREFMALLGGTAAWPLAARAQQPAMPVVGFLNAASPDQFAHVVAAFRSGMNESGYVEGKNVAIEYRWADGHYERLPAISDRSGWPSSEGDRNRQRHFGGTGCKGSDLGNSDRLHAGDDPVEVGLVASLSRPGETSPA